MQYIHDGFYEVDYYTEMVCPFPRNDAPVEPNGQDPSDSLLDQDLLTRMEEIIIEWLKDYAEKNHCKFMCAGIGVEEVRLVRSFFE